MDHPLGHARVPTTDQQPHLQVDALERARSCRVFSQAAGAAADRPVLEQLRPATPRLPTRSPQHHRWSRLEAALVASPRRSARALVALAFGAQGPPRRTLAPDHPDAGRGRQQPAPLAAEQVRKNRDLT
jgi:hypothetical protein